MGNESPYLFMQIPRVAEKLIPEEVAELEAISPTEAPAKPQRPRKLMIFQQTNGWRPPAIELVDAAFEIMGTKTGAYEVAEISEDPDIFTEEKLEAYDAIVINNTNELRLTYEQSEALQNFVKKGKGLIGLGSAVSIRRWPEHAELLGGYCYTHPFERTPLNTTTNWRNYVEDPDHPLTRMLPAGGFGVEESYYQLVGPYSRRNSRILLTLDRSDAQVRAERRTHRPDHDYAVAWIHAYGQGRVFVSQYTHARKKMLFTPEILEHLLAGIQYALGDLEVDSTPIPIQQDVHRVPKPLFAAQEEALKLLETGSIETRLAVIASLGHMGAEAAFAVPTLVRLLQTGCSEERWLVVDALAQIGPNAVSAIVPLLKHPETDVRRDACRVLVMLGEEASGAVGDVEPLLQEDELTVRAEAIKAYASICRKQSHTANLLTQLFADAHAEIRIAAVEGLAAPSPLAVAKLPELIRLLESELESRVRRSISDTMTALAEQTGSTSASKGLVAAIGNDWQLTMRTILHFQRLGAQALPAIPGLITLLGDPDPLKRGYSAAALGELGAVADEAVPALQQLLADPDPFVRHSAAQALSTKGPKAVPALKEMLMHGDWFVRLKAVQGLGSLGAVEELLSRQEDEDPHVRLAISRVLAPSTKQRDS